MKKLIFAFIAVSTLLASCSKDAIAEKLLDLTDANALIGVWELAEFKADGAAAGTNINLGEDILNSLTEDGCVIVTFEFKDDASLVTENAVNYLEINASPTGLVVPCPTKKDTETTTYTYEDGVLTYKDTSGADVSVKASVDGEKMTIDAEDLDLPNFNAKGELIFNKK